MRDIPPGPKGSIQVQVVFSIDENCGLTVSAKVLGSAIEESIKIKADEYFALEKEEVRRMGQDNEFVRN